MSIDAVSNPAIFDYVWTDSIENAISSHLTEPSLFAALAVALIIVYDSRTL